MNEIKSILVFEMLGRPADHLKSTLEQFVDKISKEEGIILINKKIHEPKKLEDAKQELFTAFAEIEIDFKDLLSLFKIILGYMPSHVEVVSPEEIKFRNFDLNALSNELARKLHQYDELAKALLIERGLLQKQAQQGAQNSAQPKLQDKKVKKIGKTLKKKKL